MQEHVLEVGQELVIEGGIRLTLLAVEAGEVLLGVTAPQPGDGGDPVARQRRPRLAAVPLPVPSEN